MTQARDLLPLHVQITTMQVPEATPIAVGNSDARSPLASLGSLVDQSQGCRVQLYPGELTETIISLENFGNTTLQFNLQIEGNFPLDWCQLIIESDQILARQKIEAFLFFQPPAEFFESETPLRSGQLLRLDYHGRVSVSYSQVDSQRQLTEITNFDLHIRPRSTYLQFLPEIYQEVDFIGRFLKIFEQSFEPAFNQLNTLWAYLNPLTSPETMLPFLAHWVGWPLSRALPLSRQRHLISQAMEIYRWRGTKRGLRFYLHLFTDLPLDEDLPEVEKHISIQEIFGQGFVINNAHLGSDSIIGGGKPYHFMVNLRSLPDIEIDEQLVRRIIEQEKPAFCTYDLYINGE